MEGRTEPSARVDDPETAHAAARAVTFRVGSIRARLVAELARVGLRGATCDDLHAATGINLQSITPRLIELERMGLVRRTAETRAGATGSQRIVWAEVREARVGSLAP